MSTAHVRILVMVSVAYVAAQMLADVGSLKIALIAGLSIDAGTLVYPFTFTLRDLVHKTGGIAVARLLIISAAAINLVMALYFQIAAALPADPAVGPQTEFAAVLTPLWRIVIASIVAEVIAELADSEVYHRVWQRLGARHQWARVLLSNAVSVPLDSALFTLIAFAGDLPTEVVIGIFISNMVVKFAMTLISLPSIYLVRGE